MENITEDFMIMDNLTTSFDNSTTAMITQGAYIKSVFDYDSFKTGRWIFRNAWKVVVPVGLFGNLMIIIATIKMKPFNSTSLFMLSLAGVDLALNIFRIPFKSILNFYSTAECKAMWYIYNVLPTYSNYILVFWTLERLIAVQFPLRAVEWCTVRRTAIVVIATGIFSFAIMLPYPISYVLKPGGVGCMHSMIEFFQEVFYKVDSAVFVFIPMIVIFLSNVLIIYRLYQSTKRHKEMTSSEEAKKRREKEQRNTIITLISVCIAFFLLHMPLAVFNLAQSFGTLQTNDQEKIANWVFVNFLGLSLMEVQNSVNFYLYFLTGRRYRQFTVNFLFPCRRGAVEQSKLAAKTVSTGASVSKASSGVSESPMPERA